MVLRIHSVEIRILGPGEESLLTYLADGVFDDPIDVSARGEFLRDPRHHLCVALDGTRVVGFATAVHYVHPDKARPELWINEVGVAPTHQRMGVGKKLLACLMRRAIELGCSEAWVLTDRSNPAAMRLYAAAGGVDAKDQVMFTFRLDPQ